MANPHLEMLKLMNSKKSSAKGDLQGMAAIGSIAKQGYDLQNSAPDPRNDYADLLKQSAQDVTGGQPAKGWRALVSGMLEGASTGLKGKVSKEKKERAEKIGRVFEWLEANSMAMAEQIKLNTMKQKADETINPLLKDYAENMGTMDPLAREKYGEYIVDRYNKIGGTDFKVVAIDQVNPLKVTLQSPSQGNAVFVKDFSENVGGVDAGLYQKAVDLEDRNQKIAESRLANDQARVQSYENFNDFNSDPIKRGNRVAMEERGRKNTEYIHGIEQKMQQSDLILSDLKEQINAMKSAADQGLVGSSAMKQALRWYAEKTGDTLTMDTFNMRGQSQMYRLKEIFGATISNADLERFDKTLADFSKNPKASINQLNQLINIYENKTKLYRNQINKYAQDPLANLFDSTADISKPKSIAQEQQWQPQPVPQQAMQVQPQQMAPQQGMQGQQQERFFAAKDNKTGKTYKIPESQVDSAVARGWEIIS